MIDDYGDLRELASLHRQRAADAEEDKDNPPSQRLGRLSALASRNLFATRQEGGLKDRERL